MKKKILSVLVAAMLVFTMVACGNGANDGGADEPAGTVGEAPAGMRSLADPNFEFTHVPQRDEYRIFITYKLVHAWYDAIYAGVQAAIADFAEMGVVIDYEWVAPIEPDAVDQVNTIETAIGQGWDMIVVDVTQEELTSAAVNSAIDAGIPVAIFAGSDLPDTDRSFFVGNNDNYGDGAAIARAVAEAMGGEGQIAILSGTIGAPSHEHRLSAFKEVLAEFPDIEIVDEQRDNDFVENAVQITEAWLQAFPELGGILANNMSNPVGAAAAISDAGRDGIVLGGMDHDLRYLEYLRDGVAYIAQVQNCFDMGYKMIYYAVMTIDGETVPEVTDVGSTSVFQADAQRFIDLLFGSN
ncbi:MAG: substrate-binding domain-containing protein [Lachnospiraceae bacterium]|nr:substrate-binding domain-containing protein [Lachnospiraceae bacterium]